MFEQLHEYLELRNIHKLRETLVEMKPQDIALFLEETEGKDLPYIFRLLPKDLASETFAEMEADSQEQLISVFTDRELKQIFDELFVDDTVDIIEEMPANIVGRILNQADPEIRASINEILQYPENSAGSIMTIEYISLKKDMTVEDALKRIRRTGLDKETIYTCYVKDDSRKLIGLVTAKDLLLKDPSVPISDFMTTAIISVDTHTDREDAINLFRKYNFMTLPVVDREQRLVGIITIDDALQVITEEATKDISIIAGVTASDTPYLKTSVWRIWLHRIPWLLILMISATFTGLIITSYESTLAVSIALTACIPMLMDTGGNAGSQASVTVIRSLALNEIQFKDFFRAQWKELRVSFLSALTLVPVCFGKLMLVDRLYQSGTEGYLIGLVISVTLGLALIISKLIGCSLPLLAHKMKFDPAVMASPLITTIVDAVILILYCNIAILVLRPVGLL